MKLNELTPFPEERKERKRIGRGRGSGQGCTAGKGNKGQNARAGGGVPAWFEGGQMPLQRRLPKGGFRNINRVDYDGVNLDTLLNAFPEATEITLEAIYERGLINAAKPLKILGRGDVTRAVTVEAHRFTASAASKLTAAGGAAKALEAAESTDE